jgi:hypothetical protein
MDFEVARLANVPEAALHQTGFLPWMTRINTMMMAKTSNRWIKPPMVYALTIPRSHMISRITAIVQSIFLLLF